MHKKSLKIALRTATPVARKAVTSAAVAAIENLEARQLMSVSYAVGIGLNDGSTSFMNVATPKLKSLGVQTLRLWYSTDFSDRSISGVLQRAIDYKARGFDVMLEVAPDNGNQYSSSAIQGWFKWALGTSLKGAVDRWEIGNEPDHASYWNGSLSQYVNNALKPAYEVLHAAGESVVSAGPSYNVNDVQTMINAGMLNYCDYVGFHPYENGVAAVEKSLVDIKSVVAGRKPLVASEWNVRGLESNTAAWAAADAQVYADIASTFALNYYYAAEKSGTKAGPAGIMYSNGAANQPFYNAFASFKSGGTPIAPAAPTAPTGGDGGNSAAGSSGTISGTLFNDDDGDNVRDNGESVTGVRTVFIDKNKNGVLDAGETSVQSNSSGVYSFKNLAAGTYYISRVFPAGYHLSNSTSNDLTVVLNPGQIITSANMGTSSKPVATSPTAPAKPSLPSTPSNGFGSISGTLFNDSNGNGIIDAGEKVTGVRQVFLDSDGDGVLGIGEVSVMSDANGKYTFGGLAAGKYRITREFPVGFRLSTSATKDMTVMLAAGQVMTGVNVGTTDN